jgi:class 3 adenylate cyclase
MRFVLPILFFYLSFIILSCNSSQIPKLQPEPDNNGFLDLKEWNFEEDGPIYLTKGYDFFWNTLLVERAIDQAKTPMIPKDCFLNLTVLDKPIGNSSCHGFHFTPRGRSILLKEEKGLKVNTPHLWKDAKDVNGSPISNQGIAIYKLDVVLPKKSLGIYNMNWVGNSAFRFWVLQNNTLTSIASIGNPGVQNEIREIASGLTAIHSFEEGPATIFIEVANYNYKYGYLSNQLSLGTVGYTIFSSKKYLITEALVFGLIFMAGVYHIVLFILRRKIRNAFWFGTICIFLSLRVALVARFYQIFFPETDSFELMNRLEYITFTVTPALCAVYLKYILNNNINNWMYRFIIGFSVVATLIVLVLPSYQFSQYLNILQLGIIFIIIFTLYELLPKSFSDQKNIRKIARSLIGVFFIYSVFMIHDILMYEFQWKTVELTGLGLIFLVMGQSVVIARMNAEAWENSDRLSKHLEKEVEIRTEQYKEQYDKSEKLLLNILPVKVAEELKESGKTEPELFESVTVCFTDFVGFTQISENMTPSELIAELDLCFTYFDGIIEHYKLEKLKTIGDSYMFAGGIPTRSNTHAIDCVLASLKIQEFMNKLKVDKQKSNQPFWELRLGINSGSLVAGVIGNKKFAYDIWSDTVNTASRCESSGASDMINIGKSTYELVKDLFECEYRGAIPAKNKGEMDMYFVKGIKKEFMEEGNPNQEFWNRYEILKKNGIV